MSASAGPISEFPTCGYLTIWLNAFLTKTESLERVHDALALKLSTIEIGAIELSVLEFLSFLKDEQIELARFHQPVSGDLGGIIDTGAYLDQALLFGQAITLSGAKNYALVPDLNKYQVNLITKSSKSPVNSWQELDRLLAEFLHSVSTSLEALDLVATDPAVREWMISLEHSFTVLEFPQAQPARLTHLLGRLTRTMAIGQIAMANQNLPISSTKNSMLQNQLEELITKSRKFLTDACNYHWNKPEKGSR